MSPAGTASSRTCSSRSTPNDLEEPHAERLLGDELLARAEIRKVDLAPHLRGERSADAAAAERAKAAAAAG